MTADQSSQQPKYQQAQVMLLDRATDPGKQPQQRYKNKLKINKQIKTKKNKKNKKKKNNKSNQMKKFIAERQPVRRNRCREAASKGEVQNQLYIKTNNFCWA